MHHFYYHIKLTYILEINLSPDNFINSLFDVTMNWSACRDRSSINLPITKILFNLTFLNKNIFTEARINDQFKK